jgi:hypothetical protein
MKPLSAALRPLLGAALAMVVAAFGPAGRSSAVMAEPPPGGTILLAQADTSGAPVLEGDDVEDEEEDVPIPPNLQDKEMLPDTSGSAPDTLREALPTSPARPDTLHMPTGQPPRDASGTQPALPTGPGRARGSLFGLAPVIVIGAIVVVTVFLIRAVGGS